ncbi:MAG: sdaAA [Sedimentibacter sp.]|jgi:L-serine dehydratase|nr:sdaAA [Sedimentibacter sp.]
MFVSTGKEILEILKNENITLAEYAIREEMNRSGFTREKVIDKMRANLNVMRKYSTNSQEKEIETAGNLIKGDAKRLKEYSRSGKALTGEFMVDAMSRAMSCSETNSAMGRIVACPTAGSCGILPAVVLSVGEKLNKTEEEMIHALFVAGGIGILIAKNATLAGAEGGCQAECGAGSAMAAAAAVDMLGGTAEQEMDAAAIVIKNILGLVCDSVAGIVEVPCAKRNIAGTVSAISTADMVMSGITSKIPLDEMIVAMYKVGKQLPPELRETSLGGIAVTPTALKLKEQIEKMNKMD